MATRKKTSAKQEMKAPARRKGAKTKMAKKTVKKTAKKRPGRKSAEKRSARDRAKSRTGTFDELIAGHDPAVQKVARTLRSLVRRVVPNAEETVYLGWRTAVYADAEAICGIQPMKSRCNFYLRRGTELDDPDDLLEGTVEVIRHVKVRSLDEMPARGLIRLVRAGSKLQGS